MPRLIAYGRLSVGGIARSFLEKSWKEESATRT